MYIVARQLFKYGNTWCFSTSAIESRGARLKRLGRRLVCWRKSLGATLYKYVDRRTGKLVERSQEYNSSAVEQLLGKVCRQEDLWHSSDVFARPEKLRLQSQLRSRLLKCDLPEEGERQRGAARARPTGFAVLHAAAQPPPPAADKPHSPPKASGSSRQSWMWVGGRKQPPLAV